METQLSFLRQVATFIGADHLLSDIDALESKLSGGCPLVLPLVGDFSSGKTSLINALTDSNALETATIPTTASIFEVHFGCTECYAVVHQSDGVDIRVDDIATLKNSELADIPVVDVYDTSTKVPSSLILVDTPGLQSTDPKHREILTNFLPQADGVLLLIDVNAQLSASLSNYIKSMALSDKQMFVVVTKTDTKTSSEVEDSIETIRTQLHIDPQNIVAVSVFANKITPLLNLLQRMQGQKEEILNKVNQQRINNIVQHLLQQIDLLLRSQRSSSELSEMLNAAEDEQRNIHRSIERLLYNLKDRITEICRQGEYKFEDTVGMQLEHIITNTRGDYDEEAKGVINSCSIMTIDSICSEIMGLLRNESRRMQGTENKLSLHCLEDVDLDTFKLDGLGYNLQLNTMGHEHDGKIATGVKIAVAAAVVAATGGTATGTAVTTIVGDAVNEAAEQVVESSVENGPSSSTIDRIMSQFQKVDKEDQHVGQQLGSSRGIVTEMVGLAADATWAKTQRKRAIHNYIDTVLMPSFRQKMIQNISVLLSQIRASIQDEMQSTLEEIKSTIETLKQEKIKQQNAYENRIEQIKQYKSQLNQLL